MKTLVNMKFGSHLYGLSTLNSDTDYKGVYLPSMRDILLNRYAKSIHSSTGNDKSKNTADDVDREMYALPYFVKLALAGETVAIDMLHCESPIVSSAEWDFLVENRTKFYSRDMKAFVGYVKRQAAKYGIKGSRINDIRITLNALKSADSAPKIGVMLKLRDVWADLPETTYVKKVVKLDGKRFYAVNTKLYQDTMTVEEVIYLLERQLSRYGDRAQLAAKNQGIDWKAMSHALRAGYQCRDIFQKGDFKYPLDESELLLAVKTGRLDFTSEVAPELERVVKEVEKLSAQSEMLISPDYSFWDEWLLGVYALHMPKSFVR